VYRFCKYNQYYALKYKRVSSSIISTLDKIKLINVNILHAHLEIIPNEKVGWL
jgi:hypothetical protein